MGKGDEFDPSPVSFLGGERAGRVLEPVENGLSRVNFLYSSGEFHRNGTISCYLLSPTSRLLDQEKGAEKEQALERMLSGYWVDRKDPDIHIRLPGPQGTYRK